MFGSLAPNVGKQDVLSLAQTMVDLYSATHNFDAFQPYCREVPVQESASPAWYQGYELAESFHDHLGGQYSKDEFVDIERLLGELDIQVTDLELSDEKVRGVSIAGPQHRPGIAVNKSHAANKFTSGYRFTLAHELCHLLFDQKVGSRLAVASGPWAPRNVERRANAFAAMLLMPNSLVRRAVMALSEPLKSSKGVTEMTRRLRVGHSSLLSHLKNLGYIDESDEQRIEQDLRSSIEFH